MPAPPLPPPGSPPEEEEVGAWLEEVKGQGICGCESGKRAGRVSAAEAVSGEQRCRRRRGVGEEADE